MYRNYLKIAVRNLFRNKVYSAINIVGLAIGISSCILIFLYIQHELSYDKGFKNPDRIYRINTEATLLGQEHKVAGSPGPLAANLVAEYAEIEHAARFLKEGKQPLRYQDKAFYFENILYADSNAFSVLDFPFIAGNPATALQNPQSIVLTEEVAQKFFGDAGAAMGKMMKYINSTVQVTGVVSLQHASHIKPDAFVPMQINGGQWVYFLSDWGNISVYTYIKLHKAEQAAALQAKMPAFYTRKVKEAYSPDGASKMSFHLQKITDIYLDNAWEYPVSEVGDIKYVYIFAAVAIFILLIASINYVNLATARAAKRVKEVGIRKVVGANRSQVMLQFMGESLFLTLAATLLALVMVELTLPVFNVVTGEGIQTVFLVNPQLALALLALVLFVGVVAGSYPDFYLSHYQPMDILNTNQTPRGGNAILRKVLVVLQFTVSLMLIIGTIVIYSQMTYIRNADLGFEQQQVMAFEAPLISWKEREKTLALAQRELQTIPQVLQISTANSIPGRTTNIYPVSVKINHKMVSKSLHNIGVDYNYLDVMGITLKEGRAFSEAIRTDKTNSYIINEAAAREFGWTDPISKRIKGSWADSTANGKVIGVIKDYNYKSLHSKIEPLVLWIQPNTGYLLARINASANLSSTIQNIEKVWQKYYPEYPMAYHFLDESFQQQYRAEQKMLAIFSYFAVLTIVIACMGLFGLAAFMAEQRTKEIGIRKVLGSSVSGIVVLLSRNFALLVLIAIVLAVPIAWYGMHKWLQDFAYRVELSWWIFVLAGVAAMAIALLTVSYQAMKAAVTDPVVALRAQ